MPCEPAGAGAAAASPRVSYFLDGAHTPESMATCADWFAGACGAAEAQGPNPRSSPGDIDVQRVLVFNCMQVGTVFAGTLLITSFSTRELELSHPRRNETRSRC